MALHGHSMPSLGEPSPATPSDRPTAAKTGELTPSKRRRLRYRTLVEARAREKELETRADLAMKLNKIETK